MTHVFVITRENGEVYVFAHDEDADKFAAALRASGERFFGDSEEPILGSDALPGLLESLQ